MRRPVSSLNPAFYFIIVKLRRFASLIKMGGKHILTSFRNCQYITRTTPYGCVCSENDNVVRYTNARRYLCFAPVLVLGVFLCAACAGCSLFPAEEAALLPPLLKPYQAATVNTVAAKIMDLKRYADIYAYYVPVNEEDLSFGVSGYKYAGFDVGLGSGVKAGDRLAALDTSDLDDQIDGLENQLDDNQMRQDNAAALQALDEEAAALKGADALSTVRASYARELNDLRIQASILQTKLDQLNTLRRERVLVAGMDGVVTYVRTVGGGDVSSKGSTMIKIVDQTNSVFTVSGSNADYLSLGMNVTITVGQTDYTATVAAPESLGITAPAVNTAYLALDDPTAAISQNSDGKIRLLYQEKKDALSVPLASVHISSGKYYVYLYNSGVKAAQNVTIGMDDTVYCEIMSGLKEGDAVILGGQ